MAKAYSIALVDAHWKKLEVNSVLVPGSGELQYTGPISPEIRISLLVAVGALHTLSFFEDIDMSILETSDLKVSSRIIGDEVPVIGESYGLALAMTIIAAVIKKPLPANMAFCAAIGPAGEVLPVGKIKEKMVAARLLDFDRVMLATSQMDMMSTVIEQCPVKDIKEAYSVAYS